MSRVPRTPTPHDQHGCYPEAVTGGLAAQPSRRVRARIAAACQRVRWDPAEVRLLPVSKTKPEASVRLIPGALGDDQSSEQDSFENDLLDHPHYTRPKDFRGLLVPDVLLSGDHAAIAKWRRQEAAQATRSRRPDLGRG